MRLLAISLFVLLVASCSRSEIGRYQLQSARVTTQKAFSVRNGAHNTQEDALYKIDTTTGNVWRWSSGTETIDLEGKTAQAREMWIELTNRTNTLLEILGSLKGN